MTISQLDTNKPEHSRPIRTLSNISISNRNRMLVANYAEVFGYHMSNYLLCLMELTYPSATDGVVNGLPDDLLALLKTYFVTPMFLS